MFEQVWQYVLEQIQTNQFFSGGAVLMLFGALLAYLRSVPAILWDWVHTQITMQLDITDKSEAFEWIDRWLATHNYSQNRARRLSVSTVRDPNRDKKRYIVLFVPAPGTHYLFYRGRLISLERTREKGMKTHGGLGYQESFAITLYSRNRSLAMRLIEDARSIAEPESDKTLTLHTVLYGDWRNNSSRPHRTIDSVILDGDILETLLEDLKQFLNTKPWYVDRGIPYRRGYMLYGPPGAGKSSLVVSLASQLGLDVAILNLNDRSMSDNTLIELMADVPKHALVLIEDIDCLYQQRDKDDDVENTLSFSGLLNAIDGVASSDDRILFITTNHPEKLDPALVRPGRIDMSVKLDNASQDQARRLFKRFHPQASEELATQFAAAIPPGLLSMAALQGHLLQYKDAPERAALTITSLVERHLNGEVHAGD